MQLDSVISMMRYWPAKGTAGFARSRVRGKSRSPAPPASKTPNVSLIIRLPQNGLIRANSIGCRNGRTRPTETRVYHARIDLSYVSRGQKDHSSGKWLVWRQNDRFPGVAVGRVLLGKTDTQRFQEGQVVSGEGAFCGFVIGI